MYFATLTEIPIIQGLRARGMGEGPALALLLAGPALSLPAMLVLRGIMGWKKTGAYVLIVIVLATLSGWVYGMFV
ncbi:MAG: permease [Planctomycetes bacterium]|nr:permease [Planctomycetota bacterium]